MEYPNLPWQGLTTLQPHSYTCGYCGRIVGPDKGFYVGTSPPQPRIYICSLCFQPTFIYGEVQVPGVAYGDKVESLPKELGELYDEARNCMSVNAFTSAVLSCRKLLMNIAV